MRLAVLAVFSIMLSGCLLPPAYQIASWTMTGFSYLFTGKSMSDHALSVALQKDCAIHRIVSGSRACVVYDGEPVDDLTAVALLGAELEGTSGYQVAQDPVTLPAEMGDLVGVLGGAVKQTAQPDALAVLPLLEKDSRKAQGRKDITVPVKLMGQSARWRDTVAAPTRPNVSLPARLRTVLWTTSHEVATRDVREQYLVIGSFLSVTNAERLNSMYSEFGTKVLNMESADKTWYRVVVGPFTISELAIAKAQFKAAGISESWVLQR